ncbi:hypothetical protein PMIN06_000317 [Paraphaeosphaeria minitans]
MYRIAQGRRINVDPPQAIRSVDPRFDGQDVASARRESSTFLHRSPSRVILPSLQGQNQRSDSDILDMVVAMLAPLCTQAQETYGECEDYGEAGSGASGRHRTCCFWDSAEPASRDAQARPHVSEVD